MICRHTEGAHHDCAYVDWRESLIPVAEAVACAEVPSSVLSGADYDRRWDAAFHRAMGRLVTEGRDVH